MVTMATLLMIISYFDIWLMWLVTMATPLSMISYYSNTFLVMICYHGYTMVDNDPLFMTSYHQTLLLQLHHGHTNDGWLPWLLHWWWKLELSYASILTDDLSSWLHHGHTTVTGYHGNSIYVTIVTIILTHNNGLLPWIWPYSVRLCYHY